MNQYVYLLMILDMNREEPGMIIVIIQKETKYRNNISSIILKKITNILLKQVRKNADEY